MLSTLLERIDNARRLQRPDTSWLTPFVRRMLAVVLGALNEAQLAYVEQCMAGENGAGDNGLMVCATVYQDVRGDRFVLKCHRCRQTFALSEADRFMAHIRQYKTGCVNAAADDSSSDDEPVLVTPVGSQPQVAIVSSDDDDEERLADLSKAKTAHVAAIDPAQFGFVSDDDEWLQKALKLDEKPPSDLSMDEFRLQLNHAELSISADADVRNAPKRTKTTQRANSAGTDLLTVDMELMSYGKIPCTIEGCLMRFQSIKALNEHTMTVHGRRPFKCPLCCRSLPTKHALESHIIGHQRRFQCDICKRFFASRDNIIQHMRLHNNTFKYKCKDCDLCFRYSTKRSIHWQTVHGGGKRKPCICDECGHTSVNLSTLRRHKRTHNDDRLFKCHLCDSAFRNKSYIRIHIQRVHTNDRPHICRYDGCLERFRNMDTRVRHEVKVHGESGATLIIPEKGVIKL